MKGKFNPKSKDRGSNELSTASLPDIVFMLLFFFMVTTVMKETEPLVEQELPTASSSDKFEDQATSATIFIGSPLREELGSTSRIQIDGDLVEMDEIYPRILEKMTALPESSQPNFTTIIRADKNANMRIINEVKTELRKLPFRKVLYQIEEGELASR